MREGRFICLEDKQSMMQFDHTSIMTKRKACRVALAVGFFVRAIEPTDKGIIAHRIRNGNLEVRESKPIEIEWFRWEKGKESGFIPTGRKAVKGSGDFLLDFFPTTCKSH